uniref:Reverse transcriptase Ty1/copia-type domain-containing protein n=1 Tax=Lactuca sativa TaxID=4236 RepID=A0A9R1W587_LACSA|nr:hypothetical protein LSAT_V11C300120230 [Lactuca sativa]
MQENVVYRKVSNGEYIIVAVYVDDLFVTTTSFEFINQFKKLMALQFEMLDLGELTCYLGIEVLQENSCVKPGLKFSKAEDETEVEAIHYRKQVVGVVNCYMQCLKESHARVIKQILRYLCANDMSFLGYSDNRHNVDVDGGRSRTRHQDTVALSSCEVEFIAATADVCQRTHPHSIPLNSRVCLKRTSDSRTCFWRQATCRSIYKGLSSDKITLPWSVVQGFQVFLEP